MTTSWKASPSSTRHKDRTVPIFDSSVSSLLGEIDEMLIASSSSAKKTQQHQQQPLFTEDMTPPHGVSSSAATPSRSLNNQLQVSLASTTTNGNGNGIQDQHHHQQQQQFLTRPIAVTSSSNSNSGTPSHHYYHQQNHQSPQELFLSSPSPIRHHPQDDDDDDNGNNDNDSSRTVIRSSCPNPETLQQASSLFHYRAWSRLEWHAKTQIINFDDQDPVGYFLEGYSCFQQFLNSSSSASCSLSVSKRQELLDKSILSFGKCLVLLSQIEGCDLNTVVWEQQHLSSFENDQNNNNNNEGDFTVGDVMNLVQMLEEQQKDFAVLATANYQNQNQNQQHQQNSILASHRSLDTQEQHDIERKRQQMKEASPPRVVPLPSAASTSSPPDDDEKQTPATTTPKPFKDFRSRNNGGTGGDDEHASPGTKTKNTNNSPNYNNFLEDFIESSLANSEEKLIAYQDKMMGTTTTTPRAERMRMLKKLRSNGEIDELNEELQKSRSSKTPTADFLARQRGEQNNTSTGNQQEQQQQQQRSSPVQDLNPDQLAKNNVDEQQQPFYMKPITIPTWLLILLVALSYLGVRSLTSSTSTSSQPPQPVEQQSSSTSSATTSNTNNNQNEAENVMKNEQKQTSTSNGGGGSSKPNKKKRFGFW